jgi:hypothetical protein
MNKNLEIKLFYNDIQKNINININQKIGNIQEIILNSCNIIIYNIEYTEAIFSKDLNSSITHKTIDISDGIESKYILGSDDLPFDNFLNIYLENEEEKEEKKYGNLKTFIIYDRKRDDLGNVIKNNYIIDRYNKWFESNEINIENISIIRHPINNLLQNIFNISSNIPLFNEGNININHEHSLDNMINIFDNYIKNEQGEINNEQLDINNIEESQEIENGEEDDYIDLPDLISLSYMDINLPNFFNNYQDDVIVALSDDEFNSLEKIIYNEVNEVNGIILSFVAPNDGIICDEGTNNYSGFRESVLERQSTSGKSSGSASEQALLGPAEVNEVNEVNESKKNQQLPGGLVSNVMPLDLLHADGACEKLQTINKECSVCLENFIENDELIKLKCNHNFHYNCIKNWLCKESNKCPVCRIEVAKGKPINI